ncbi:MAG: hypothetical protein L6R40_008420 [Gallowayella cf. fulva]|nr:MAG: hypothetical protein L6R40_008420 [Xanthomendoza cf. fulva]
MHLHTAFYMLLTVVVALRRTEYPVYYPRCANDRRLTTFFGTTDNVIVQPHCDVAIDSLVRYVYSHNETRSHYTATSSPGSNGTDRCQAYLLDWEFKFANDMSYAARVQRFQNITVDYMLIGVGKWAKSGGQAGVMNVNLDSDGVYTQGGELKYWHWSSATPAGPGYMVGPPGYFRAIEAKDVSASKSPVEPTL